MELSFIIIDDSELDCFIARKIIEHTDKHLAITTFQNALDALDLIGQNDGGSGKGAICIILLDLQMPLMNGFQFVEAFEKFTDEIRRKYMVIVISSTRNTNDIARILAHKSVHSRIEKPLTFEKLSTLIEEARLGH